MSSSIIFPDLEKIKSDTFDSNLHIAYDEDHGLDALQEVCTNDKYSWIRERAEKLTISGIKGIDARGPDYFVTLWHSVAKPGCFPRLRSVDVTYEARRYKFRVKDADFEMPTEEWFRVRTTEYAESFRRGDEDIEYEFPDDLIRLRELKQSLAQNGKENCDVFLTTRVTWAALYRHDQVQNTEDEGHQTVKFKVLTDDLEGVERFY